MPIMVTAKKSWRVMIEPPEKSAGDRQSVDMEAYQQQISFSGKYQSARKISFPNKPSMRPLPHFTGNASGRRLKIWVSAK